ncbi:hypothetical protein [Streptomyces sp. NPDC058620]|uniref:hypothetical protein n=1 Tax=Streptomyces sp. NPDC058620 TaxID=3346560 RepID=UPI0036676A7F
MRLRRSPLVPVCAAVALVQVCGILPAQIDWADNLPLPPAYPGEGPPGAELGALDALRLLTVSPTWLYGEYTATQGVLHEAGWLALFLLVLCVAASAAARRMSSVPRDRLHLPVALFVLAAPASLATLLILRLPRLTGSGSGELLAQTLQDTRVGAPHTLLLALVAAQTAAVHRIATAPGPGSVHPRRVALFHLASWRGPKGSLPRRIGISAATGLACCVVFTVLDSQAALGAAQNIAGLWCLDTPDRSYCTYRLGRAAQHTLPQHDDAMYATGRAVFPYARLYGYQACFLLSSAACYALLTKRGLRERAATPVALLIRTTACYTAGTVMYGAILTYGLLLTEEGGGDLATRMNMALPLLLHPAGLHHALLGAPVTAVLLTTTVILTRRLRTRRAAPAPAPVPAPERNSTQ